MRNTVVFPVPVPVNRKGQAQEQPDRAAAIRWLTATGDLTDQADKAIRFRLYRSPTMAEVQAIEIRQHELAGGLDKWLDIHAGLENSRARAMAEIVDKLWPRKKGKDGEEGGRPKAEGEALEKQEQAIQAAWATHDSKAMKGWYTLFNLVDRITFAARWEVLGVDLPDGWRDLYNREWKEPAVFVAIWRAAMSAMEEAERGKEQPSES